MGGVWGSMQVIYAGEPLRSGPSVFLAGPTPRRSDVKSWRPDALQLFEQFKFTGAVYVPEDKDGGCRNDYDDQVEWETAALEASTVILFWLPRNLETMPGFTTNDEWGFWKSSGKVVLGVPPEAEKVRYQRWWAQRLGVPTFSTLSDTVAGALVMVSDDPGNLWVSAGDLPPDTEPRGVS